MKQAEKTAEPPASLLRSPIFMIGQDSQGHWVVCEPNGTRGGLFVNRAEALRYIRSENENHFYPTVIVSGAIELYIADRKNTASRKSGIVSRVTFLNPVSFPPALKIGVITTSARNAVTSLRRRHPASSNRPSVSAISSSCWRLLGAALSLIQILNVAGAVAADLPVKADPSLPLPLPWIGFYIGANVGGGFSHDPFIDDFLPFGPPIGAVDASPRPSGWVGGLQAGYNYQINSILLGLEGGFTWLGTKSSFSCFPLLAPQTCTADPEWVAAVTGRLGVLMGPALLYVKGGPAWIRDTYTDLALPGAPALAVSGDLFVGQEIRPGWTAGVGLEYMFLPSWSLRLEYDYYGFADRSIGFDGVDGGFFTELIRQKLQTVTLGVDYHFGAATAAPAPILAKARSSDETDSNIMAFTGVDVSKFSASGWIGTVIAPSKDLDTSGLRVWVAGESGGYLYHDGGAAFHGIYESGEVLAGYGFEGDNYSINLLAGPNAINHMVSPYDPTNRVQGTEGGIKVRADAYLTPATGFMSYSEGEYSTAFQTYWASEKIGFDVTHGQEIYVGPEVTVLGDERFNQWRVGAHISNMKIGKLEIDLSAGFADDSIVGTSAYTHVELSENF